MLVTAIESFAEAAYHHPDRAVTWGSVHVKLKNHAAGGVTDKGFEVARKIEEVVLWRPAAGGALEGTPNKFVRSGDPRGAAGGPPRARPHGCRSSRGRSPGRPSAAPPARWGRRSPPTSTSRPSRGGGA